MGVNILQKTVLKFVAQLLLLLIIVVIMIAFTSIPRELDFYMDAGKISMNMPVEEVTQNVKDTFDMFISREIFDIVIFGQSLLEFWGVAAKRSLVLLGSATLLTVIFGGSKGVLEARKKPNASQNIKLMFSLVPLSLPDVMTVSLVQIASIYLYYNDISLPGLGRIPFLGDETWQQSIYPILALSILPLSYFSRMTASTIETGLKQPYILVARGKGCSQSRLLKNHLLKDILYHMLAIFPTIIGILFSSMLIVERLFHYKGMGYYLIDLYITSLLPERIAELAFSWFLVSLVIFYFLLYAILQFMKELIDA